MRILLCQRLIRFGALCLPLLGVLSGWDGRRGSGWFPPPSRFSRWNLPLPLCPRKSWKLEDLSIQV